MIQLAGQLTSQSILALHSIAYTNENDQKLYICRGLTKSISVMNRNQYINKNVVNVVVVVP